ncbi:hypothetical protein BS78_04G111100 [Paspalum vaginatum]|nr:hypothetical protein BS78_04G111100 [Paspalum vaginatum]KAJ1278852.1 hypothetical protein BS78_04G111100 [Paspalum vaginatum]KAJ1278853.1 hypothetical protein BS78_04G111100 [Paspalum vaginatum]KAJ1278854.1 hypothetical protein BS78_04G111100 [Paspalum vaginatum]KAJ1278855.1 hypothetical protein BS78_04G111100 [Paspalum vaginatum]
MAKGRRLAAAAPYLPAELIPDIARHLTTLQDFFALRAACRSYRAALPPSRAVLASQPPHLLVPHHAPSPHSLALIHLQRRRLLRFRAHSPPFPGAVVASDGARVVTFDRFARELHITHLLSGERVRVPDAPFLFSRAVLAGDLVILIAPGWVQYCRLGEGRWQEAYCRLGGRDGGLYMMVCMLAVNGVLYALLNTCHLAVAELMDNKVELKLLGGEVGDHVRNAWMESKDFMLGQCAGEPLLIFKVSIKPEYKVFRWEPGEQKWVRTMSLGRRTLFMSGNGFDAWLGPDSPGIRGDCIYEALPRAAGWSEYSLVDDTSELVTVDYQGAPELDAARKQVWVLPSLY